MGCVASSRTLDCTRRNTSKTYAVSDSHRVLAAVEILAAAFHDFDGPVDAPLALATLEENDRIGEELADFERLDHAGKRAHLV